MQNWLAVMSGRRIIRIGVQRIPVPRQLREQPRGLSGDIDAELRLLHFIFSSMSRHALSNEVSRSQSLTSR